jgi:GT2 family glycosyltransferase
VIVLPRSEAPLASILIVTERNHERLALGLRSLEERLPDPGHIAAEVVIALNAATPETRQLVAEGVRGATLASTDVRIGFAGGLNLARSRARGRYLISLHDDAMIEPGWLEALVAAAEAEPAAGAVGSLVLNDDGTLQSCGRLIWRNAGTSPPWPVGAPPFVAESIIGPRPTDYASSSSLLIRAASFDAMGGAEEELHPALHVDAGIGLGVRRLGQFVLVEPKARVRHRRHGTTGAWSDDYRRFLEDRNRTFLATSYAAEVAALDVPEPASPAAVESALARVERWAAECRRRIAGGSTPLAAAPLHVDPEQQSRRALAREARLALAWAEECERRLEALRAAIGVSSPSETSRTE